METQEHKVESVTLCCETLRRETIAVAICGSCL